MITYIKQKHMYFCFLKIHWHQYTLEKLNKEADGDPFAWICWMLCLYCSMKLPVCSRGRSWEFHGSLLHYGITVPGCPPAALRGGTYIAAVGSWPVSSWPLQAPFLSAAFPPEPQWSTTRHKPQSHIQSAHALYHHLHLLAESKIMTPGGDWTV